MRWSQVQEPEGAVFYGVLPGNMRVWLQGQLQVDHPEHYAWELEQLQGREQFVVCVDLEPRYGGLYKQARGRGGWWWQTRHLRNLFWDDPQFAKAVEDALCVPLPDAQWAPAPPVRRSATLSSIPGFRVTGPNTWELVSTQKNRGKDRYEARKGWRR